VAVLRITLSLIFVVCVAAPAAAQFAPSDLAGLWTIQGAETASSASGTGGWVAGAVVFNDTGQVLSGRVVNDRGEQTPLEAGRVSVSNDGSFSGTIRSNEASTRIDVRGRILPGKQVLVTVTTSDQDIAMYSLAILVKATGGEQPLFSQGDLTGTWRSASLLIPGFPARQAETLDGSITFDAQGGISGATLRSSNGSVISAVTGNLALVANGAFAGAFSFAVGGPVIDDSIYAGFMSPDKTLLVGITTRIQETFSVQQNGIFVLQREPSGRFTTADAGGPWDLFSLQSKTNQGDVGEWLKGNISVTSNGRITGSLTGPGLKQDDIVDLGDDSSNRLQVDPNGTVSGNIVTKLRILTLRGTINTAKDRIVGVDVLDLEENFLGFFTLLKADAVTPPPTSTVQFRTTSTAQRVTEGSTATLTVDRTGASTTEVTVDFQVTGGTATRGSDFNLVSGNLTIPAGNGTLTFLKGETAKTFTVVALPDTEVEGDETVTLALINPTGGAVVGTRATAVVTIGNSTVVQFQQPVYSVKENVATAMITAVRTGASTTPFTVTYTATPITAVRDVDFKLPATNILTFAAGVLTRTISVTIVNNARVDGNRSFMLTLGQPTNGVQLGAQSTTNVTIQDDDQAGQFKVDKPTYTVAESAGSLSIIVRRIGTNLAGNVTVDYSTEGGTAIGEGMPRDYAPQFGTLTFKAGETMKTVAVPVFKDNLVDGPKTFTFALSNPQPAPGAQLVEGQSSALVTITDVDLGGVVKFVPDKYTVSEGVTTRRVTLTVQRTGGTAGGVTVDYATVNGTAVGGTEGEGDFDRTSGTLTFGFGVTSVTFSIPINQDTLAEGNETFTVVLSNPRGGAALPAAGAPGSVATVTIVDDESAFQFSSATYTVKEGTPNAVITVLRTGTLTSPATVTYSATPGTAQPAIDFTPVASTLSFPASTPSKTFTVPIINNTRLDGNRSVFLALGTTTGGAQLGTQRTATLNIEDNEQAGTFKLDKGAYTVLESAGFVSVNVLRSGLNLTGNVSVNLVATDGNAKNGVNYTAPAAQLIFAASETRKTVKVPILRDFLVTGPQKFTLALSEPSSGATVSTPGSATVNITEADSMVQFSGNFIGNFPEVVRLGNTANEAFVDFDSIDGTAQGGRDYTPTKGTITFKANTRATTIPLVIVDDILAEGFETFTYRLQNPRGTRLGPESQKTFRITDNDFGGNNIQFTAPSYSGAEGQSVTLTITRTGAIGSSLVVQWSAGPAPEGTRSATPGVDFSPAAGSVTFAPRAQSATFTINLLSDNLVEGLEAAVITLSVLDDAATLGAQSSTILQIQDVAPPASVVHFTTSTFPAGFGQD
jgi:hypothetical protein